MVDLLVAQRGVARHQTPFLRLGQHLGPRNALPVIGNLDHDAAAAMFGAEEDRALPGLAAGQPLLRQFNAMVERVAQQMGQRIGELLDDGLVDFGSLAADHQADVLAEVGRDLPHQAGHAREHRLHRLRSDRHDAFLHLPQVLRHGVQAVQQPGAHLRRQTQAKLREHCLVDHEFADQVYQPVHLVDVYPDRRAGWRSIGGANGRGNRCRRIGGNVQVRSRPQRPRSSSRSRLRRIRTLARSRHSVPRSRPAMSRPDRPLPGPGRRAPAVGTGRPRPRRGRRASVGG